MHCPYLGASGSMGRLRLSLPRTISALTADLKCFKIGCGRNLSGHTAQLQWVTAINDPLYSPPDRLPLVEDEVCVYGPGSYGMAIDSFGIVNRIQISSTALCLNRVMAVAGIPELCGVRIKVLELGITLTPRIGASLSWARLFSRSWLHIVARVRNPQPDTEKSANPNWISIYHEDSRATPFQICHSG